MSTIQSVITLAESRAIFLRKQFLYECIPFFILCARDQDYFRQHLMLQLWVNLTAFPNGQIMVIKCITNENIFDLVSHYVIPTIKRIKTQLQINKREEESNDKYSQNSRFSFLAKETYVTPTRGWCDCKMFHFGA